MKVSYKQLIHNKKCSLNLTKERLAEHTNMDERHFRNTEKSSSVSISDSVITLGNTLNMNLKGFGKRRATEESV